MGAEDRVTVGSSLPKGLDDDLERYCDEHGVTKSEAIKQFVRDGLEQSYSFDDFLGELSTMCGALAMATALATGVGLLPILAGAVMAFVLLTTAVVCISILNYQ